MGNKRSSYSNKFDFFVSGFISMFSLSLAVYAIYISGGVKAMNQPVPLLVLIGFIIAGAFCILAIYNGIMMLITPRDTRLDDLIQAVKDLKPKDKIPNSEDIKNVVQDEITPLITKIDALANSINESIKEIRKARERTIKKQ